MVRIRGTTPMPDHESEPVPQQPASPVLVPPSRHSASDIGADQPRSSTPAPERESLPQQTPPVEVEERHERPPSAVTPIPPHPTVIQVPGRPPSRSALIRMMTPRSRPPEVTTIAQPAVPVAAAPIEPEQPTIPGEMSPHPPTIVTVPAPFTAPTSQVRVKSRTQDRAPAQTLPPTVTEPLFQPTEPAAPTSAAVVPERDAPPPSHSPVVIELPGETPSATVDVALGRATPVIQVRSQPVGYSPIVIGTPSRPPTVTLRARSRSQVRGPPVVHEVATPTPTAFQQVIYGRGDQDPLRPQVSETGSFLIHSPQPISVPVARDLENLVNQEAQRTRDAIIRQLLEEQRAFMEEHRTFMARAARATAVAQGVADGTAAQTASLRASVQEAAEETKRRSSAMASIHSIVLDEHAASLAAERQRAQELEEKLAALRTRRAEQRANREKGEQEKCEEGRIAAAERHQGIYNQLGDITNRVQDASHEKVEWRALQNQRWDEKQERQDRKATQVQRLEEMMARIMEEQENARHMAEEDAAASANRPGYAQVIAQLEHENQEQLVLLQRLLACESVSTLIPTHSDILSLQPIKKMSSIAIAKRSRQCGKLPKNTFHLIFPTI